MYACLVIKFDRLALHTFIMKTDTEEQNREDDVMRGLHQ